MQAVAKLVYSSMLALFGHIAQLDDNADAKKIGRD